MQQNVPFCVLLKKDQFYDEKESRKSYIPHVIPFL